MPEKPFFRKHDGWWYIQLRQGSKRFLKKLVKGKENRQQAFELFNQLMAEGTDNIPSPTRVRVCDVLAAFLKHAADTTGERTFEWYKFFLVTFDDLYGSLKPHQVTGEIVDAWLNAHPGWKGCRRGAVTALKRAFNWAADNNKITRNPLRGYKKPPARARERYLTVEERQKIFDRYPEGDCFRDFLFAMENTAGRPGEVAMVTAEHFEPRTAVWVLDEHKTEHATAEPRVVILTPAMVELTRRLITKAATPTTPLFLNEQGKPWTRNAIRCRFRRVRKTLGLGGDLVAYLYRHAVATDLLESGTGLAQAAEILGHKDVSMIQRQYSKLRQRRDHLREQMERARKGQEPR
jgi:site-specific recombinase XerD